MQDTTFLCKKKTIKDGEVSAVTPKKSSLFFSLTADVVMFAGHSASTDNIMKDSLKVFRKTDTMVQLVKALLRRIR